ncbi:solute carrier family 12 member 2-like [Dysidea avara]|uniref:solute carrier family 12 member 2-like n=1 Tax=Dysidea avara TaxID=196820 RepID=UPI00332D0982
MSARIDDSTQQGLVVFTSGTRAEQQEPDTTPRIRFQIESVDENVEPLSPDVIWPPRDENDDRVLTADAVPMTAYYRGNESSHGRVRPSLVDLHEGHFMQLAPGAEEPLEDREEEVEDGVPPVPQGWWGRLFRRGKTKTKKAPQKFGWIMGVLVRCMLNIWGVMLFIRLSWVVGQAGIGLASVVILLSACVTILTTLSMSAICTNGEVKGGGAYYLISRSLGPEFGGAIGIIFSLANAIAVSLYVVGFAETVGDLIEANDSTFLDSSDSGVNLIRVVGFIIVTLLLIIALVGLDWEAKVQIVLLFILLLAIVDALLGVVVYSFNDNDEVCFDHSKDRVARGFTGFNGETFSDNFGPGFRGEGSNDLSSFFSVFSIFFPAATGILAGANISGDLKDPQVAIPKGTLLAIFITGAVYLGMAWLVGASVSREVALASGCNVTIAALPMRNGSNGSCVERLLRNDMVSEYCGMCKEEMGGDCERHALLNSFQVVEMISLVGPIITAGIFSATLSSALASLIGAPKIFQRVCQDKIFPYIGFFAKGQGRTGTEPIRGYLLTYVIAAGCIVSLGDLNAIAPIISNFFLMAYALINYACFAASFTKSPGWRPSFKFYNQYVSLCASLLCLAIMFIINWWTALITIVIVIMLYSYVSYKKPDVNWGSYGQAFHYSQVLRSLRKMETVEEHVKNYRPQLLVLTGPPSSRPDLVYFAYHISKDVGSMICGEVLQGNLLHNRQALLSNRQNKWLNQRNLQAFYHNIAANSIRDGVSAMLQLTGIGKMRPNTVVMGYKCDWNVISSDKLEEYFDIINNSFHLNYGICIFRLRAGFDVRNRGNANHYAPVSSRPQQQMPRSSAVELQMDDLDVSITTVDSYKMALEVGALKEEKEENETKDDSTEELITMPSRFEERQGSGFIDVWWLYDDGGLAILLPYLLAQHNQWKNCKLRVFTATATSGDVAIDSTRLRMTSLLRKFRINFSQVVVIDNMHLMPSADSINHYKQTVPFPVQDDSQLDNKTLRQIRLGELIRKHSSGPDTRIIFLTIPVPQKNIVSAELYMSWLEVMSYNLPPIAMVRGNQTSVVTFYS